MSKDTRQENRFEALKRKYEADIAIAKAELENYFVCFSKNCCRI